MTNHQRLVEAAAAEVRAEMGRQRKTASDLASVLGTTVRTASRRMNGEVEFSVTDLVVIAAWLEVDVAVFVPSPAAA